MAVVTTTERIKLILSDPAKVPMTLAQIVGEEIKLFKESQQYKIMVEANWYYRNRTDVQRKTNDLAKRSNTKIEHPILKKMVDQKAAYLLSKPFSVQTGDSAQDKAYGKELNELFDPAFRRKVKSLGKAAIVSGIAWMQPYFDNGRLAWRKVPATELVPLWSDDEHTKLDAFIRFYEQTVYEGIRPETVVRAELWHSGGVKRFKSYAHGGKDNFVIDTDYGDGGEERHFTWEDAGYDFDRPPIVWVKYNEEELPLCYYIKELIDDYNWQTSVTADVLRDVAKFIYVIKNYGGTNLDEFIHDLKQTLAIKVNDNGGVDKLQADLNIDAVMAFLDKQRRDLYDYAAAVDTKDPDLGNASGTAINFRYMDLDADCAALGLELQDTFQQMKPFIDTYLQAAGKGRYAQMTFDVIFNADMPVNETDIITNAKSSSGVISRRTILENHPWVEDVDKEMEEIQREKQQAMEEYGEGLFDPQMITGQESGNADGEKQ